jgi:hypothetical protein
MIADFIASLNSSVLNTERETPSIANFSGRRFWTKSEYKAGTSLRFVKSPEAPKMI